MRAPAGGEHGTGQAAARPRGSAARQGAPAASWRRRRGARRSGRNADTGRAVADHAVGGVDRLVREHAGQARAAGPRTAAPARRRRSSRRSNSIAARATACASRLAGSRPTICATARRPLARLLVEPGRDRGHVLVEAAPGEQRAHQERQREPAVGQQQAERLQREADERARGDHQQARGRPRRRCDRGGCARGRASAPRALRARGPISTTGCGSRR